MNCFLLRRYLWQLTPVSMDGLPTLMGDGLMTKVQQGRRLAVKYGYMYKRDVPRLTKFGKAMPKLTS